MDHPAVDLWRRKFSLNLSKSWKADVEKTVTDLKLWKSILDNWWYWKDGKKVTKHPGIKGLLTEYERQKCNQQLQAGNRGNDQAASIPTRCGKRIPLGRDSDMPSMSSEAERNYFNVGDMVRRGYAEMQAMRSKS